MNTLEEFENNAKTTLPKMIYDYYASGSCDEITLQNNRLAYDYISLIPRVLKDISKRDLSTSILGQQLSFPAMIAPTSFHGMATEEAEIATARAAKETGIIMISSTMANTTLEDISAEYNNLWFQLFILNDKNTTLELIQRAEKSGFKALILTVDSQILGIREKDLKNKFVLPQHLQIKNLIGSQLLQQSEHNLEAKAGAQGLFNKKLTWDDVSWVKSNTKLPIFLKGILHKKDAKIAVEHGVNGIIVSNHGGRQLDTTIPTINALPEISSAISSQIPILIDGGIRRGTDIIKALALGADAVLVGRPIIWGLVANGAKGAVQIIEIFKNEFDTAMALCGFTSIKELRENGSEIIYWNKK